MFSPSRASSPRHYPGMPPELIDRIIGEFSTDNQCLSSRSLVCKTWLPSSKNRLFRSFTLKVQLHSLQKFSIILDSSYSSDLLHSIGDLRIVGTKWKIDSETRDQWLALVPKFSKLIFLETLQIDMLSWEDLELHSAASCILRFPKLRVLDISCVRARSFSHIFRTVSCCSKLSSLGIVDVVWDSDSGTPVLGTRSPLRFPTPPLRHLTLTRCQKGDILEWLIAGGRFDTHTSVCLEAIQPEETETIAKYIQALGDSLTCLSLDFDRHGDLLWENNELVYGIDPDFEPNACEGNSPGSSFSWNTIDNLDAFVRDVDLGCNSALPYVLVAKATDNRENRATLSIIPYVLSQISSSYIDQIELVLPVHDVTDFNPLDWQELDETLLTRRRMGLNKIVFGVRGQAKKDVSTMEQEVKKCLGRCDEEGLCIEVVQWI